MVNFAPAETPVFEPWPGYLGDRMPPTRDRPSFDFIIVGSGSSGAVLAARLSEDTNARVLLLEAGGRSHPLGWLPISYGLLLDHPKANWRFRSAPEPGTFERRIPVPRGKLLGGSSAINGLVYVRGQTDDYDHWAQLGNRGWSWSDVAPVFQRMESYQHGDPAIRGRNGPLRLTEVRERNRLYDAMFAAVEASGFRRNHDYNGAEQDGIGLTQASIHNGRRMSTAACYLRPAMLRRNLRVVTGALAMRVILDGKRCVGIVYDHGGKVFKQFAAREVILSAGSFGSPQLLELSGIGNPDVLTKAGIPVEHSLPAVGDGLRDHMVGRLQWQVKVPGVSHNTRVHGVRAVWEAVKYLASGQGFLGQPGALLLAFLRTRPELASPDIQLSFLPYTVKNPKKRQLHSAPGMTLTLYQLRPESLGSVHVQSGDPREQPEIRFNFLDETVDQNTIIDGFRLARRIIESAPLDDYRGDEVSPGQDVQNEDEILDWMRRNAETAYHPIGTCRMGRGPRAVVDERLRVHGIEALRVADASIMPTMPSGNTNAPCIMIGEKASDMIRADYL